MAITNFIDSTYINAANIAVNPVLDNKKTNEYIDRAMYDDVRPLLGDELYWDLAQNPTKTINGSYPDLLNGIEYTYGSYNYQHKGIKYLTLMFWYARHRYFSRDVDSSHGFANVNNQFISTTEDRDRKIYESQNRAAFQVWDGIRDYLIRKSDNYTLWFGSLNQTPNQESGIVIRRATLR